MPGALSAAGGGQCAAQRGGVQRVEVVPVGGGAGLPGGGAGAGRGGALVGGGGQGGDEAPGGGVQAGADLGQVGGVPGACRGRRSGWAAQRACRPRWRILLASIWSPTTARAVPAGTPAAVACAVVSRSTWASRSGSSMGVPAAHFAAATSRETVIRSAAASARS